MSILEGALREKCPNAGFFWSVFSRIWIEYGYLRSRSSYSVQMRENTDQKKIRAWTLFTQWRPFCDISGGICLWRNITKKKFLNEMGLFLREQSKADIQGLIIFKVLLYFNGFINTKVILH